LGLAETAATKSVFVTQQHIPMVCLSHIVAAP